jgi:hypothetical protein
MKTTDENQAIENNVTATEMTGGAVEIVIERASGLELMSLSLAEAKALMIALARIS